MSKLFINLLVSFSLIISSAIHMQNSFSSLFMKWPLVFNLTYFSFINPTHSVAFGAWKNGKRESQKTKIIYEWGGNQI